MSSRTLARLGAPVALLSLTLVGLATGSASAHVSVTPSTTAAGAYTVLTISVPHGCEGSPTTGIVISIPEGVNAVTPTRNPLYEVTRQSEVLDPPVTDAHGNELTERVDTVTYTTKSPLPDGFRDTFELSLQLPEDAEGETLAFPVLQSCEQGETAWTEIPAEGQSEDDLDAPAPVVVVTAAGEEGHHDEPVVETTDEDADGTESAAATEADSGNGLALAGLVAGVAGLLVGGTALLRGRTTA